MANRKNITEMFNGLEGTEDLFKDELPEEVSPEAAEVQPEMDEDEYKKWLEEGIKAQKGYGTKETVESKISEEEMQDYYNSSHYSYQVQSDTTAQMIKNLKEKDNQRAERDHLLLSMLPKGYRAERVEYSFDKLIAVIVYAISFAMGWALGFAFKASPAEKWLLGSITGIVGTFVKLDGVEHYPFEEIKPKLILPIWTSIYILIMWIAELVGIEYAWIVRTIFYIGFVIYCIFYFDNEYHYEPKMARIKTIAHALSMLLIIFVPSILLGIKIIITESASSEGLIEGVDRSSIELLFRVF